jgi:hypothetical protein
VNPAPSKAPGWVITAFAWVRRALPRLLFHVEQSRAAAAWPRGRILRAARSPGHFPRYGYALLAGRSCWTTSSGRRNRRIAVRGNSSTANSAVFQASMIARSWPCEAYAPASRPSSSNARSSWCGLTWDPARRGALPGAHWRPLRGPGIAQPSGVLGPGDRRGELVLDHGDDAGRRAAASRIRALAHGQGGV